MRKAVAELALLASLLATPAALAEPMALGDDAAIEKLSRMIVANAGVERLHWVVADADATAQTRIMKRLAIKLGIEHGALIERVRSEGPSAVSRAIGGGAAPSAPGANGPVAYVEAVSAPRSDCSWTVSVSDPALPSLGSAPTPVPLGKGETMALSARATFEVGASGLLQSTLYAFAETTPGAIRDLAAAPEYAIPAAGETETLVLVRARKSVPYLDSIKERLADHPGDRGDLGGDFALARRFSSGTRGIGALIQLVDPKMVVAEATVPAPKPADDPAAAMASSGDLQETCIYTLTPALSM